MLSKTVRDLYTHTHTYIYVYIYVCVCVCMYIYIYIGQLSLTFAPRKFESGERRLIAGVCKFFLNLEATSKFYVPEW